MPEQYVVVRQATILDLDLLTPLFDAYRQFYRKPSDLGLARRFLLERFQHNQSIVFLAVRQNGSAVGFTQLFPSRLLTKEFDYSVSQFSECGKEASPRG
jgi:hypothetical protein